MSDSTYKSLANLVAHINTQIENLQKGDLSIDDLSELLENTRELHERATVLNYLAIERKVKGDEQKDDKKEGFRLNFGISKKTPEVHPNQTNLLDAIAEQNVEPVETIKEIESFQPIKNEVEVKVETEEAEIKVEEANTEEVENETSVEDEKTQVEEDVKEVGEESVSINEKFAKDNEEMTLAEKLSLKPIDDLKKAIGLNQKFLFMNDLFEGENGTFNEALEQLNSFSSYLEAEDYMNNVLSNKYNWDSTSKSVKNFSLLVKRRYK